MQFKHKDIEICAFKSVTFARINYTEEAMHSNSDGLGPSLLIVISFAWP